MMNDDSIFNVLGDLYHKNVKLRPENAYGVYKIKFNVLKDAEYELKVAPYERTMDVACIYGEKGELLKFEK